MAVTVWIEQFKGKAASASWEALGKGRVLADALGTPLTALVFGQDVNDLAAQAIHRGADDVITADDATLADYRLEPYAALLSKLVAEEKPQVVLAGGTSRGRELLAASAVDTGSGLLADVLELSLVDGALHAQRAVYGGKLISSAKALADGTQYATLRSRAFPAPEADTTRTGDIRTVDPVLAEETIAVKINDFAQASGEVSLTDAAIIVA
ncbi:MAG: electron transfer flavoprotein subunit alpha/FixB family protein, partial [Anaerolineae bacterium]|nr:electron transfer flavoprotein subunit alpha/FixB family protein [Anaerolineae bacterium]